MFPLLDDFLRVHQEDEKNSESTLLEHTVKSKAMVVFDLRSNGARVSRQPERGWISKGKYSEFFSLPSVHAIKTALCFAVTHKPKTEDDGSHAIHVDIDDNTTYPSLTSQGPPAAEPILACVHWLAGQLDGANA